MSQEQWTAVDKYFADLLIPDNPAIERVPGMPAHDVAPNQGKLLMLLAQIVGARKILEIGTLGGYSTIWLARGLADGGRLITLEADPKHAAVAGRNIDRAGLRDQVEIRVGRALETLPELTREAPFDLIFVDADKANNPGYLEWSIRLSRPGSLIVADNVVRDGAVIDEKSRDASVQGVRSFLDMIAKEKKMSATAIQTVGSKGWDGFAIARVL